MPAASGLHNETTDNAVQLASWFCRRSLGRVLVINLRTEKVIAADPRSTPARPLPLPLADLLSLSAISAIKNGVECDLNWPLLAPLPSKAAESIDWRFVRLAPSDLAILFQDSGDVRENSELAGIATDELTGLALRGALAPLLLKSLTRFQASQSALAVLFVDFDHFKHINDTQGHLAGDELLRRAAAGILHAIRPGDFAVRFGGDEFVLLINGLHSPEEALGVARRVAKAASTPLAWRSETLQATASVGVAFSRPSDTPETILERADQAMYRAKKRGRNGQIELD